MLQTLPAPPPLSRKSISPNTLFAPSSLYERRHRTRDRSCADRRGEILVNAYEQTRSEKPNASSLQSSQDTLSDSDPFNFVRYSVIDYHIPPVYDDHGRQQAFYETARQQKARAEFSKRKIAQQLTYQRNFGSGGEKMERPRLRRMRTLERERAAVTIQRAYRAHHAYDKLTRMDSRVDDVIQCTRDTDPAVRVELLHELISELGSIGAILDESRLTAGDPRVFRSARYAASIIRQALEQAEGSGSGSSSSDDAEDDDEEEDEYVPVASGSDDDGDNVWVYAPRFAQVQSSLDLSAFGVPDKDYPPLVDTDVTVMDVLDSDSDIDSDSDDAGCPPMLTEFGLGGSVSDADYDSDCTVEDFHHSVPQVCERTISPSREEAELQAKARLASLKALFSSNNRRWAGPPVNPFPPPAKRARNRSPVSRPPPPKLYAIEESESE